MPETRGAQSIRYDHLYEDMDLVMWIGALSTAAEIALMVTASGLASEVLAVFVVATFCITLAAFLVRRAPWPDPSA